MNLNMLINIYLTEFEEVTLFYAKRYQSDQNSLMVWANFFEFHLKPMSFGCCWL